MKRRLTFLLLLVSGIGCAVFFIFSRGHPVRHVLPDGSALTLIEVKVGAEHCAPMGSWRQRLARRLPSSWHSRLKIAPPPQTYSRFSQSNYLSVWLLVERTNHSIRSSFSPSQPPFDLLLGDEDGSFTCNAEHHGSAVEVPLGPGRLLMGFPVAAWPRRAEQINIQVFPRWGWGKPLTEFRVKNPARDGQTLPWTAPPWPITVTNKDLEFTLTSLWLGLGRDSRNRESLSVATYPKDRSTRATFRVTRGGEVLTNWNAYHVRRIEDATGNWSDGNSFHSAIQNGETFNQFGRPPLPAREAWRMTVEFSRVSGFETGELHMVRGVPVLTNGGVHVTDFGPDAIEINWERRDTGRFSSNPPGFTASVRPIKNDYKITLVRATDNLGRDVPHKNRGGGQSATSESLTLARDAVSVDLVFAFHASQLVTFQVKPEFYRP